MPTRVSVTFSFFGGRVRRGRVGRGSRVGRGRRVRFGTPVGLLMGGRTMGTGDGTAHTGAGVTTGVPAGGAVAAAAAEPDSTAFSHTMPEQMQRADVTDSSCLLLQRALAESAQSG
jgi:hypothetical protein